MVFSLNGHLKFMKYNVDTVGMLTFGCADNEETSCPVVNVILINLYMQHCVFYLPPSYKHYRFHDDTHEMPLKWFECQPVISNKVVVMHLQ